MAGWSKSLGVMLAGAALVLAACGADPDAGEAEARSLRLYTTVTEDTVQAVVDGFTAANPGLEMEVFRAPTGELTARIAAEMREGGIGADVLWLTDPLSMQQYEADGLLLAWDPEGTEVVPEEYATEASWGTRVLNLVIVHSTGLAEPPSSWSDLTGVEGVVLPDPGFAGSAFAALGFFALSPEYGMDYYRELAARGAVQVQSPGDVISGVAQGLHPAGITLDNPARTAIGKGSPIEVVWPEPGAIALHSPVAVVTGGEGEELGRAFVEHVLGVDGQRAIAATGWQPVHPEVEWPHGGPQMTVDWSRAYDRQEELLDEYRSVFSG